jgi:hypothetical protein
MLEKFIPKPIMQMASDWCRRSTAHELNKMGESNEDEVGMYSF